MRIGKRRLKAVMNAMIETGGGMTAQGVSDLTGMPKNTAYVALKELAAKGFFYEAIEETETRGRPRHAFYFEMPPTEAELELNELLKGKPAMVERETKEFTYSLREPLKKTRPELNVGRALDLIMMIFDAHPKVPRRYGRPDYGNKKLKTVIFVDGSFWHGGKEYERLKDRLSAKIVESIEGTKKRDKEVTKRWEELGWTVIRIWEEETENTKVTAEKIRNILIGVVKKGRNKSI